MHHVYLGLAILAEVVATSALKASDSFTRPWPTVIVIVGYIVSFYLLTLCLDKIPIGVAYAIWSGVGTALTALIGASLFGEALSTQKVGALAVIVAGVVLLELAH